MPYNELRKDYLIDRWVVIATERGRRPTDFAKQKAEQAKAAGICPLCPGNEDMTPPAVLLYLRSNGEIEKTKDENGFRHKDWLVRCIPNLFPAFSPPKNEGDQAEIMKNDNFGLAVGHHEVLIESPNHNEHPSEANIIQLQYLIDLYVDRLRELSEKPYVSYVSIFRNQGLEAGASLSHPHSQIITTPFVPRIIAEELAASKKFWSQNGKCVFCDIIERESKSPRLVEDNEHFVIISPYASFNPMEFWIIPKRHSLNLLDLTQEEKKTFAETLKHSLKGLKDLVNDPPYNFGFHMSIHREDQEFYHWHLEVYPKLAIWAGFEKSTGMYINTVTPETAATELRRIIQT
jgi:UDPglucose--hexose-1-phosphate uridylyltransferase